jgi:two-component system cell cycle response regulator DivK
MTGHRILVVEDNERNLKLVRDVLQYAGFEVIEARSGELGVELAVEYQPELVLMDLKLPGIGGEQALHLIRDDDRTHRIPVVALTASAMQPDRARVLLAGFDGYLEKPISVPDFPGQVRQFLTGNPADE